MTPRLTLALAGATLVGAAVVGALAPASLAAQTTAQTTAQPAAHGAAGWAARDGAWTVLFDGTPASLAAHWRGYRRNDVPTNWHVENGVLTLGTGGDSAAHGDLITRDQYGDFELEYEWKISPGGNSGLIYRVAETAPTTWQTGPEMQVLDDARHADGKLPSHRAGALYDLIAPPPGVTRPVGEFNRARIVMRGMHVQTYVNGRLTADLDFASPRGRQLIAASKFHVYPDFATERTGFIALQDHGDVVTFRNIRIRRLDERGAQ
ncbi:glycosyl hydrolase [Gemmatimonadetes bacterium T265]|nr:glycosyl hydrolase [Gemmatimonadetes bacterium T265]